MDTMTRQATTPRFAVRISTAGIARGRPWTLVVRERRHGRTVEAHLAYFADRGRALEFCERMNGER